LLTESNGQLLTIKSKNYGDGKDIKIPYGMQFEVTDNYLIITAKNLLGLSKIAKIPWK
jgi:hypothetical protein